MLTFFRSHSIKVPIPTQHVLALCTQHEESRAREPSTKSSSERSVKPLPAPVIYHFLFPYWYVAAVVTCGCVEWGESSPVECEGPGRPLEFAAVAFLRHGVLDAVG